MVGRLDIKAARPAMNGEDLELGALIERCKFSMVALKILSSNLQLSKGLTF